MKKITFNNCVEKQGNKLLVKLPKLNNIKVINSNLTIALNDVCFDNVQVDYLVNGCTGWENVDTISGEKLKNLTLNISDEVQDAFDRNLEYVELLFHYENLEGAIFEEQSPLEIKYIANVDFQENANYHSVIFGDLGNIKTNLATGRLAYSIPIMSTDNNALPLSLFLNRTEPNMKFFDYKISQTNFSLNLNQYLIKENLSSAENDESALNFVFIDENGIHQNLEEKYYYFSGTEENKRKIYIGKNQVTLDLDGSKKFIDIVSGKNYDVFEELTAPSGYKLISSLGEIEGSHLVDYEPEELAGLKKQILELKQSNKDFESAIKNNDRQICVYALSKEILIKQLEAQINGIRDNAKHLKLQKEIEFIRAESSRRNRNFIQIGKDSQQDFVKIYLSDNKKFTEKMIDQIKKYYGRNVDFYCSSNQKMYPEDVAVTGTILSNESSGIFNLGFDYTYDSQKDEVKLLSGMLKSQEESQLLNEEIYSLSIEKPKFLDMVKNAFSAYKGEQENVLEKLGFDDGKIESIFNEFRAGENLTFSMKDLILLDMQIDNLITSNLKYFEKIDEQNDLLTKYVHQKELLEMQVPVHYLCDEDGVYYGFGKTSCENIFRLNLILDNFENTIIINYKDLASNNIESINDSAGGNIVFNYNEKNQLIKIVDAREKVTKFDYENDLLKTIESPDSITKICYYSDGLISAVIGSNGQGVKVEYDHGRVLKLNKICTLSEIGHNNENFKKGFCFETLAGLGECVLEKDFVEFAYNNIRSTTVTNGDGKTITYIFDEFGNTKTVYEGVFSEGFDAKPTKVMEFAYKNSKKCEKTTKLPYSTNYFEGSRFNAILANDVSFLGSTNFVGESAFMCKQRVYNSKIFQFCSESSFKTDEIVMSNEMVAKLNNEDGLCDHKTLIASCWAKANSAFVPDDNGDYAQYVLNRKFCFKIVVNYADGSLEEFSQNFDWRNTGWQYCSQVVKLENKQVLAITGIVDYSNNTGEILFSNIELCDGDFEHADYDENERMVCSYSGHSKWKTIYEYEGDSKNVCKQTIFDVFEPDNKFETTFEYSKSGRLFRTSDYKDNVTESVFNDKGAEVETLFYNKKDPSSKLCSENRLDENGKQTSHVNELGKEVSKIEYLKGTGLVASETDTDGSVAAYGYDNSGNLVSITKTINGIENSNIFGFTLGHLTSVEHNDFEINYGYDAEGRLTKLDIAGENYLTKNYLDKKETTALSTDEEFYQNLDDENRPTEIYYKSCPEVEPKLVSQHFYDAQGNVEMINDCTNGLHSQKFSYDKFGNVIANESEQHSGTVLLKNEYGEDHKKITKCSVNILGDTLEYEYETENNPDAMPVSVSVSCGVVQTQSYDKLNRLKTIKTNNLLTHYSYLKHGDHATNLVSGEQFSVGGKTTENTNYVYDDKGNILEIRKNNVLCMRYEYDGLSRLVREDNKKLNKTTTFAYDAGGNIVCKTEFDFSLANNLNFETGTSFDYFYAAEGWRDQLVSFAGEEFEYDSIGNPTKYRNHNLQWEMGRQLKRFGENEYEYNASGIRTSKTINGTKTKFYVNGTQILRQEDDENKIDFLYGTNGILGFMLNGEKYVYRKNIQGDVLGIVNESGVEIGRYVYDAWGRHKCLILTNNGEYTEYSEKTIYTSVEREYINIINLNPIRYRSYYYDSETELYYLNSRYYDPEIGRFINADDISYVNEDEINGINLYAYCGNDFINRCDPNGYSWKSFWNGVGNWFKSNWVKLTIGAAFIIAGAVVTFLTAGMGIAGLLAAGSALLASAKAVGISMAISAGVGAVVGGITEGWDGALQGLGNGIADGFMWGGIFAGSAQILSGVFKIAANTGIATGRKGGIHLTKNIKVLSPNNLKFYENGGTLLKIGRNFRLDVGTQTLLHMHFFKFNHFPLGTILSSLIGGIDSI